MATDLLDSPSRNVSQFSALRMWPHDSQIFSAGRAHWLIQSRSRPTRSHGSTAEKCVSIALGLLRRRRLLCWFAENAATTFAQTSPLLAHAGSNTLHIRNF